MWFCSDPNTLWSPRPSPAQPILLFPVQNSSTECSDEFGHCLAAFPAAILTTVQSPFPSRRTGMSKRPAPAPRAVSRAGRPVLSSTKKRSSFLTGAFPLSTSIHSAANLQVNQIQNGGPYLHLSSLTIFLPHHHRHRSFSKCSARSHAVLEIVNAVLWAPPLRVAGCSHRDSCFRPKSQTLDTLTNNEHPSQRSPPPGAGTW